MGKINDHTKARSRAHVNTRTALYDLGLVDNNPFDLI
jgi:hypothetical protein